MKTVFKIEIRIYPIPIPQFERTDKVRTSVETGTYETDCVFRVRYSGSRGF